MKIADLNSDGKIKWIICKYCGDKFLLGGVGKHIPKCVKTKSIKIKKKVRYDLTMESQKP